MKKSFTFISALIVIAFPMIGQRLYAATFMNGSFEAGIHPSDEFITLYPGDTSIHHWDIVGENSVDYIGSFWNASDGKMSLDMSGLGAGSIEQTFGTMPNVMYKVTFDIAGSPNTSPSVKKLEATINSGEGVLSEVFSFDTTGHSSDDMGWLTEELFFTAEGSTSTLRFTSLTNNPFGPALDNVTVSVVPLPLASVFMLSGLLGIAGFKKLLV
jgi:choice-of-anchor C domain-containing protein